MVVGFDEKILDSFGIIYKTIQPLKGDTVWIVDNKYILKQSSAANIIQSAELAEKLVLAGISVATYIRSKSDDYFCEADEKQYCLMTKLNGEHINPFDKNVSEIGHKLGFAIANLYNALKNITLNSPRKIDFDMIQFNARIFDICYLGCPCLWRQ